MALSRFSALFILALACFWANAEVMDFCGYDFGAIHYGQLHMADAHVMERLEGMRSKVECATYCYANRTCRTAVYQQDGDCLLISNFTDFLGYESVENDVYADQIIEMRAATEKTEVGQSSIPACPSTCGGYSVCFLDCSYEDEGIEPEAMCMDITTTQYTTNECGFQPMVQSKEYYLSNLDRSSGSSGYEHFSVTFEKLYDWTTLHVRWRGTLRGGYGGGGSWGRWRILFNGGHCGNPNWIESINYNSESDTSHHKATGINGICYALAKGTWAISLNSEVTSGSNFHSGYATWASRLYVDEIGQGTWTGEPAVKPCPSLNDFNYREHVTTTSWSNEPTVTLWNFGYTKMEADTILRINVDLTMRQHSQGQSSSTCATWYILIDGGHCSPQAYGKTLANLGYANEINNEHRSSEMEGHCQGVSAGYHTLSLYLASCPWGVGHLDVNTGWNSCRNRVIINELRKETNIGAVMAPDGQTLYRVPMLNIVTHALGHPARGEDEAVIWTIPDYTKLYSSSGLRIAMSADSRTYYANSGSYDPCCRHYFNINNAECTDPGTIEGINYLNKRTNLHRPNLIEGVCEGIAAGTVNLNLASGKCKGYSRTGECYWGWNSYVHLIISESYVQRQIIQY